MRSEAVEISLHLLRGAAFDGLTLGIFAASLVDGAAHGGGDCVVITDGGGTH